MRWIKRFFTEDELRSYILNNDSLDKVYAKMKFSWYNSHNEQVVKEEYIVLQKSKLSSPSYEELKFSTSSIAAAYPSGVIWEVDFY